MTVAVPSGQKSILKLRLNWISPSPANVMALLNLRNLQDGLDESLLVLPSFHNHLDESTRAVSHRRGLTGATYARTCPRARGFFKR